MSAHPALAQWIFRAGFPANDPITELAAAWAAGEDADARTIQHAIYSAERWREARDKKLKGMAGVLVRKLTDYLHEAQKRAPTYRPKYGKGALTSGARYSTNPRTGKKAAGLMAQRDRIRRLKKKLGRSPTMAEIQKYIFSQRRDAQEMADYRRYLKNPRRRSRWNPDAVSGGTSTGDTSGNKTNTETGGSSPGGASTGGVGSGIGGAGTGGAATGGASTGGAGTVTLTLSGNSGTGSNRGGGGGSRNGSRGPKSTAKGSRRGEGREGGTTINISGVGGTTDAGNVRSGDGPGSRGVGGSGRGSGGGGGGASPDEPDNFSTSRKDKPAPGRRSVMDAMNPPPTSRQAAAVRSILKYHGYKCSNPISERDWHIAKQIALAKTAKRAHRSGRRVRPSRRGMRLHLVGANPRRRSRRGRGR